MGIYLLKPVNYLATSWYVMFEVKSKHNVYRLYYVITISEVLPIKINSTWTLKCFGFSLEFLRSQKNSLKTKTKVQAHFSQKNACCKVSVLTFHIIFCTIRMLQDHWKISYFLIIFLWFYDSNFEEFKKWPCIRIKK